MNAQPLQQHHAVQDVRLAARLEQSESALVIHDAVTNGSPKPLYVLDAYPSVDAQRQTAGADVRDF